VIVFGVDDNRQYREGLACAQDASDRIGEKKFSKS